MATCQPCGREVGLAYLCMKRMEGQIPFGVEPRPAITDLRCGDCHVGSGGFHYLECRIELCARCGGRLRSSGCRVAQNYRRPVPSAWRRTVAKGGVRAPYSRDESPEFLCLRLSPGPSPHEVKGP